MASYTNADLKLMFKRGAAWAHGSETLNYDEMEVASETSLRGLKKAAAHLFVRPRRRKHRRGGLAVQSLLEAKALLARDPRTTVKRCPVEAIGTLRRAVPRRT